MARYGQDFGYRRGSRPERYGMEYHNAEWYRDHDVDWGSDRNRGRDMYSDRGNYGRGNDREYSNYNRGNTYDREYRNQGYRGRSEYDNEYRGNQYGNRDQYGNDSQYGNNDQYGGGRDWTPMRRGGYGGYGRRLMYGGAYERDWDF